MKVDFVEYTLMNISHLSEICNMVNTCV